MVQGGSGSRGVLLIALPASLHFALQVCVRMRAHMCVVRVYVRARVVRGVFGGGWGG